MIETKAYDVAIIGGGPAGSTAGTLLKKYHPELKVVIVERENFPREHVGESQLPPVSKVLNEMGCWDAVERAGFPIKIGATYRWGRDSKLWDFNFIDQDRFTEEERPARYSGQRLETAFQVERSRYDKILLDHAASLGVEVRQGCAVTGVDSGDDYVTGLCLKSGEKVSAKYYLDGSGSSGVLRKALAVGTTQPTSLKNIALWSYWENAEWAVEIGNGGTRVLVLSVDAGWIWFIPLGPTRTSIGFVSPANVIDAAKDSIDELYAKALSEEPLISSLLKNAKQTDKVKVIKDWSYVADRMVGKNWMLIGESCGFADPILAAGLTLTHASAREAAYCVPQLLRQCEDVKEIKAFYEHTQASRIRQHIRFADFWYSANGQFQDLQEYTSKIAEDAGLHLTAKEAFQWLAAGGFSADAAGQAGIGGLGFTAAKQITNRFTDGEVDWLLNDVNQFEINLTGARPMPYYTFSTGKMLRVQCYQRGNKKLIVTGINQLLLHILESHHSIESIVKAITSYFEQSSPKIRKEIAVQQALQALEVMLRDQWVKGLMDSTKARLTLSDGRLKKIVKTNTDIDC